MIYTCIKYPLPGLVYIFVYNNSRVSLNLLYITIDECLLLSCCAWVYLFSSKHCRSRSASFLPDQDPHCFLSLLVNTCSFITDKKFGRNYIRLFSQLFPQKCIKHLCKHTSPAHNLRLWPKRPPLAFSVAETS